MIFDMLETTPYLTNCYLIGDEQSKTCAVVDPGGSRQAVLEMVERSGLRLEKILLTHGHYDHVKEVDALADMVPDPGVAIYLHRGDVRGDDARLFPPLAHGFNCWEDGDIISIGSPESGVNLHVLHTPGHSAGSVTLLAEGVIFCGDTLFAGSCGRWDLPGGGHETLAASLARLEALDGDYKVCPGHGPLSTLARERKINPHLCRTAGL